MFKNILKVLVLPIILAFTLSSCESGFFGFKTSLDFIEVPDTAARRVAYVPVLPVLEAGNLGMQNPVHINVGFDRFLYVVDTAVGIICLDETGRKIGEFRNPDSVYFTSVTQDRNLDLLCLGRKLHPVRGGRVLSLPVIYRISLKSGNPNGEGQVININTARVVKRLIYPFFLSEDQRTNDNSAERIRFGQIGIVGHDPLREVGNRYYVTINSPDPTPGGFTFENNTVLYCNNPAQETSVLGWTQIQVTTSIGIDGKYFRRPGALVTYVQPPQNFRLPEGTSQDFIVAFNDDLAPLPTRVNWMTVSPSVEGPPSISFRFLAPPQFGSQRYLYTPFRFNSPTALAYAGDGRRQLWVVDKDSVFLFNNLGAEGSRPARGSTAQGLINVSFGGTGNGILQFNKPRSIAYLNETIWVVDSGNKRILRYRLTTDID